MEKKVRYYTAAEIVDIHLGRNISDIRDTRYQPGRYKVDIFLIGDHCFAAPKQVHKLPKRWNWHEVGEYHGRKVFRAHLSGDLVEA